MGALFDNGEYLLLTKIKIKRRYSFNKKQRKKGKKAKPVRYISTCAQTETLFGNYTLLIDVINMFTKIKIKLHHH
jgi:hypothetical protein